MKTVQQKSLNHKIVEEELRLLARVSAALSELSAKSQGSPDFDSALIDLRDQIAEAKPEDIPALVEQMIRISAIAARYGKGRDLPINPESPYFAHLQLNEDERVRDVLIGKHGFVDRRNNVNIVDWRNAPVSRIYYRYEEGDDYEERFGDKVLEGYINARRNLSIDQGHLRRIGCPQVTLIADERGAWHEHDPMAPPKLSGGQGTASRPPPMRRGGKGSRLGLPTGSPLRSDKHLPEIAALIDPVQFNLITRPESGLVVLQGGAGSGKTTVALHRVAYLNYAMPGRFRPDKIQVIVLSEAMVRYVERVLPSLGVQGVPVQTGGEWFRRARNKIIPRAPKNYHEETPAVVLRFKKHPLIFRLFQDFVQAQMKELERNLQEAVSGHHPQDGIKVMNMWQELANKPPVQRCAILRGWLQEQKLNSVVLQRAQTIARQMARRLRDILADWSEILTDRQLLAKAVSDYAPGEFSLRDIDHICTWCARQIEEGIPSVVRSEAGVSNEHFGVLRDDDDDDPYISLDGQDERAPLFTGCLDPVDDSLLLYLALLKHGTLRPPSGQPIRYEHLVIDEAQDLSIIEIKVLLECTSDFHSVTLAGDTAQRLVFDNAFSTWEALLERIGAPAATNQTLRLGYRSTEQIMELARHLAGEAVHTAEMRSVRSGALVELHNFTDQGEAVAMLADALRSLQAREPLASVALLARFPEQAQAYAAALTRAEVPGVRLVLNQDFSFKAGIEVTDVTQVKGLEFDYVILLDVTAGNYPDNLESRHLLYIAATRAAHQLWLISVGNPSPVLPKNIERR